MTNNNDKELKEAHISACMFQQLFNAKNGMLKTWGNQYILWGDIKP